MNTPPFSYGDEPYDNRSVLRTIVFEIANGRCEHPVLDTPNSTPTRCPHHANELAHIFPRGMGHTGYRDTVNNCIAACQPHARSTDNMSSPLWAAVPTPHDRIALTAWVKAARLEQGWAL